MLQLTETLRVGADLGVDGGVVVAQRQELLIQGGVGVFPGDVPQRPERLITRKCFGLSIEHPLGAAAEHLDEEGLHGCEVVVDQAQRDAGFGCDPTCGDGAIALLQQ